MSKAWIILRYELINTLTRRSFILTLILVPLIPAIIIGILGLMGQERREVIQDVLTPGSASMLPNGYVDHSGIIKSLPQEYPEDSLVAYLSEAEAQADLLEGELNAYYIVSEDYIDSGKITLVNIDINPVTGFEQTASFEDVLRYNLLGEPLYQELSHLVSYDYISLTPQENDIDTLGPLVFYLSYGVTLLFYMLILLNASLLLNNISKEKENRVMELLMATVKPIDLFTGKITASGLIGLLQVVVWFGSAILIMRLGGTTLNIPDNLQLQPSLIIWGILFFILGYGLYGSLMAGAGAMIPKLKEASQATLILISPMIVPLMFVSALIEQPNSSIATILSLIPFTAPVSMMTRLARITVPTWQLVLSLVLLAGTVVVVVRSVSKVFHAQMLLTGQKFSISTFIKVLISRAD